MKPTPNAAPIKPKLCARFSGGVTSARYAPAALNVAPNAPAIIRPSANSHSVGANASNT